MANKNDRKNSSKILIEAFSKEILGIAHVNLAQDAIVITEDKAYRCLAEWKKGVEARDRWITPACLLASLIFTYTTSSFHDALGATKDVWQSVSLLGVAGSALWTLFELARLITSIRGGHTGSVDDLILRMKKGAIAVDMNSGTPLPAESTDSTDQPASIPAQ